MKKVFCDFCGKELRIKNRGKIIIQFPDLDFLRSRRAVSLETRKILKRGADQTEGWVESKTSLACDICGSCTKRCYYILDTIMQMLELLHYTNIDIACVFEQLMEMTLQMHMHKEKIYAKIKYIKKKQNL